MYNVQGPIFPKKCKHYVLETCINFKGKERKRNYVAWIPIIVPSLINT